MKKLHNMIKRDIRKASLSYLFELNDRITRDSIKSMINRYLNDILLRRAVQPAKSVEFKWSEEDKKKLDKVLNKFPPIPK